LIDKLEKCWSIYKTYFKGNCPSEKNELDKSAFKNQLIKTFPSFRAGGGGGGGGENVI